MITNLFEKTIQIRKPQFEKFILSIFKTSKMERLSLDLDAISFRARYMIKHGKDLSSLPLLQEEFTKKALELRNVFGITMRVFMDEYVGYGEFNQSDLIDVLAEDVKMDSSYITFTINIISNNIDYLNYVDKILSKEKYSIYIRTSISDSIPILIMMGLPKHIQNYLKRKNKISKEKAQIKTSLFTPLHFKHRRIVRYRAVIVTRSINLR